MDPLRIFLFSGLVLHKLLWEFLKWRDQLPKIQRPSSGLFGIWFIKPLKALTLVFFAIQTLFLDLFPITPEPSALRLWGSITYVVGLIVAMTGRAQLGRNWIDIEDYQIRPKQSLTTGGIYRYIRHPIYTGDILLLIGLELALNSWLVVAVLIPLLIAVKQALAEETLLKRTFPTYQAYCKNTKRFVPFIA
jgi:protein-S-isoprenylcysteine O-methyltransferase Ste14